MELLEIHCSNYIRKEFQVVGPFQHTKIWSRRVRRTPYKLEGSNDPVTPATILDRNFFLSCANHESELVSWILIRFAVNLRGCRIKSLRLEEKRKAFSCKSAETDTCKACWDRLRKHNLIAAVIWPSETGRFLAQETIQIIGCGIFSRIFLLAQRHCAHLTSCLVSFGRICSLYLISGKKHKPLKC